jgi:hypothetical protein
MSEVRAVGPGPGRQVTHANMLGSHSGRRRRRLVDAAEAGRPTWSAGPLPGCDYGGEEVRPAAVGARRGTGRQQAMLVPCKH